MFLDLEELKEIEEKTSTEYIEMIKYTIAAYEEGKIGDDLIISGNEGLDMSMVDLDAVRWHTGDIDTQQLIDNFREFYMRR